jgi:YVTN family beta-propeller protein
MAGGRNPVHKAAKECTACGAKELDSEQMSGLGKHDGRNRLLRTALAGIVLSALLTFALSVALPQTARADGGAPNLAYIAGGGAGGGDLVVLDIGKRAVAWHVALGSGPVAVALSTDGRFAYVLRSAANAVSIVDARAQKVVASVPVGPAPQGMTLDLTRNPNLLYIANTGANTLTLVDPDAQRVVATLTVGQHPAGVAVAGAGSGIINSDPNDAEIYVANSGDDTVSVLSAEHRALITTIPVPGGPQSVVVPASGGVAYVGTRSGAVVALDLGSHEVLGTLLQRDGPIGAMDYDAVTGQIYVPDAAGNAVDVLRPAAPASGGSPPPLPREPLRTLPFSGAPAAVAITFDGAYGFVALHDAGKVAMLDVSAHNTLATIVVGGAPRAIITGSYPPLLDRKSAAVAAVVVTILLVATLIVGIVVVIRNSRKSSSSAKSASKRPGGTT